MNPAFSLFILADSISIHYGPFLKEFLGPEYAVQRKGEPEGSGAEDVGRADINGGDSAQVLAYLRSLNERGLRADVLLLNAGLHDIRRDPQTGSLRTALVQYCANLAGSLAEAGRFARRTLWVRTTPVDDELHNTRTREFRRYNADVLACNRAADEVMADAGIPVIDLYTFSLALGREAVCDHVHYTAEARRLQAAYLVGAIHSLVKRPAADPEKGTPQC